MTKPRKTKRKRKEGPETRGRPPSVEKVKVMSMRRDLGVLRFTISEDIVLRLVEMHDKTWGTPPGLPWEQRQRALRLQFVRFRDVGIPGVMVRLEPPTFDPRAPRLRRAADGRRFVCQIAARKIGVEPGITTKELELLWSEHPPMLGLVLIFPDGDMTYTGPKVDMSTLAEEADEDLVVR